MNQQRPKGKRWLTGSSLNPQGIGRPRQHADPAAKQKAYRDRKKASSVTKPHCVGFPIVRDSAPAIPTQPKTVKVHDCYTMVELEPNGDISTNPKRRRCNCSTFISADDAAAQVADGVADWMWKDRYNSGKDDFDFYQVHSAIVLRGGFEKREAREAAEAYAVANPDETNTDLKAWEAALKSADLSKNRGRLGKTGGIDTAVLERLQHKADKRATGGRKTPDGTTPNWESLLPTPMSPALVAKIEFDKTVHRLSKPTKKRRALSHDEIAYTMSCDVALVRQILKEKQP